MDPEVNIRLLEEAIRLLQEAHQTARAKKLRDLIDAALANVNEVYHNMTT